MNDYDPELDSDEQEDEPEVSAELLEEFESRVAQEDSTVVATPLVNELYPFLARMHFTADWEALYGEARALERSHKNFHIYRALLSTAVSTKRPVLEQMMWRLEAVRRVGHATTHPVTVEDEYGVPTRVSPWLLGLELADYDSDGDRIESIASARGIASRIHALLDRAALHGLDEDADEELADAVRSSEEFLPRASARLRQIDTARAQAIASQFRRMSSHPAFAEWYAAHYADYVDMSGDPTRSVARLLDETWIASVPFNRRESPLRKAEYAIERWNIEVANLSEAGSNASLRPGDARDNPAVPDTLTGHVWKFSTRKPLFRLVLSLTIFVMLLVSIGPLQAGYVGLVRERQCESARAQVRRDTDSRFRDETLAGADPDSRQSLSDMYDLEMIQFEENFVRVCADSDISLECITSDSQYRSDHCRRDWRRFWRQVVAD